VSETMRPIIYATHDQALPKPVTADTIPDQVRVIQSTAGHRRGDVLSRDPRHPDFLIGPAWICVSLDDIARGWGVFFRGCNQ